MVCIEIGSPPIVGILRWMFITLSLQISRGEEERIKRSLISPYRQMGLILIYILQNI